MSNWLTVKDMYDYAKTNNLKLLSNYGATFWSEYVSNSTKYDKLFSRLYSSFRYFYQDEESVIATLTTDFIDEVENHLMLNNKKYTELYRVKVLNDTDYNFSGNLNVTEVMDKSTVTDGDHVLGQRSDSTTDTQGQRQDSTTSTVGAKTDTSERQVSAFNASTYSNADKTTDTLGAQTNSDNFTKGSQSNSSSLTKGSQTNTDDITVDEDYTFTRKGKDGDKPASEYIKDHIDLWTMFEFYSYVFNDICAELLLV